MKRRITRIEVFEARLGLKNPFRIAIGCLENAENLLVRLETSDGLVGYGEGAPTPCVTGDTIRTALAAACEMAPALLGQDPLNIGGCLDSLRQIIRGNPSVLCAFDMALYDLAGRAADLPLYAFWGGGNREIHTDFTLGIRSPLEMAEESTAILSQGYDKIKIKLGTTRSEDVERVRRIRQTVGEAIPLRIDANQGWDEPTARMALEDMGPYVIYYCESPVPAWDIPAMARIRARSPIPIMADEALWDAHDAIALVLANACDYFNIKLNKSGGLREALKIQSIAEGAGIRCMTGCMMESRLGLTAAAHFASAFPNIAFANLDSASFLSEDPILGGAEIQGGTIRLSDEPGLGASLDPDFLNRCERRIFEEGLDSKS